MNEMFSQGGKGSTGILTNKQAIARKFGVKQNEVVYFSVGVDLGGYKVIYDKSTQRAYSLPSGIVSGTTAVSLGTNAVLLHSAGSVDLGELAVSREEYVTLPGSFDTGATLNVKNELLTHTTGKYRWDGELPKTVSSGSTLESAGGTGLGKWVSVGDVSLRTDLANQDGLKLIGKSPSFESLRNIQPSVEGQLIILDKHSTISAGGGIFEAVQSSGLVDDNGLIAATSSSLYWKRKTKVVDPFMFGGIGDGVSDDSLAVKAAVASGYDVDLSGGNWLIDACTLQPENGVTVKGGTLIKNVYSTDIPLDGVADAPKFFYIAPGKKNITIDGVTFNYTGTVLPRVFGVVTHQSENVVVKNCHFTGNETAIFIWKLSKNTKITGNTIDKGHFGIATGGDNNGNTNGVVSGIFITKNNITGCNSEAIDINWDTQFAVIEDNRTYGNNIVDFEEEIDVGGGVCTDIRISNNTIDGGSGATRGIQIKESCRRVWVNNNRITTSATPVQYGGGVCLGTYVGASQDVWIEDNQISGFLTGIYATRDHVNIHILKNNISVAGAGGTSYGIQVDMGTNYNINIKENKVVGGSSTSNGIVVANTDGAVIEGNNVSGFSSGYGIQLSTTTRHARVYGNEVRSNGNGIINSGIKNVVHGNHVIGNTGRGILIEGQYSTVSNNQIIDNNTAQGATVYGLVVAAGCDFSVVSGNNILDTRATKYQNGMQFGVSDRVIVIGNNTLPNAGTGVSGNGGLTNSQFANNITS